MLNKKKNLWANHAKKQVYCFLRDKLQPHSTDQRTENLEINLIDTNL